MAINAVELTPGWPFAGKVRLKEGRNGRQLPPQRAVAVREGVRLGGHDSNPPPPSRNVYNTTAREPLPFHCLLNLPPGT